MKTKILLIGAIAFLFFSVKTNAQQATSSTQNTSSVSVNKGVKYVDKNNDGVCDNKQAKTQPNKGVNYVDKNKDGVCDNRQNKGNGKCCGYGKGNGNGQGYQHRHGWNGGSGCCKRISK
jgi:hypothetical protein